MGDARHPLRGEWEALGYSKHALIGEHLEYAIIEALLWEVVDITYVWTSGSDKPSFPGLETEEEREAAVKILAAARKAVEIRRRFEPPEWEEGVGFRTYVGLAADEFEKFALENRLVPDPLDPERQNAFIAADRFVEIAIRNRTFEESWEDWNSVRFMEE